MLNHLSHRGQGYSRISRVHVTIDFFIEKVSRWHRVAYSKRIYKILVSEPARELGILGAKNEPRTKETVQVQRIQTLLKSLK